MGFRLRLSVPCQLFLILFEPFYQRMDDTILEQLFFIYSDLQA